MLRTTTLTTTLFTASLATAAEPVDVLLHLYDVAGEPVCDAQVQMEGVAATVTNCVYTARPTLERDHDFVVSVRHDQFVDEDWTMAYSGGSTRGLGSWTLRRPGDAYVILDSRRTAVAHEPDALVVFTTPSSHDPAINRGAVDQVAGLAERFGYGITVVDRCGSWWEGDDCLSKEIQLRPLSTAPGARSRSDLLLRLRDLPTVAGAGPLIGMRGNVMALAPHIDVALDGTLSADECVAWVESTGLDGHLNVNERRVRFEVTRGSGWSVVEVAEALMQREGAWSVSNAFEAIAEDQ